MFELLATVEAEREGLEDDEREPDFDGDPDADDEPDDDSDDISFGGTTPDEVPPREVRRPSRGSSKRPGGTSSPAPLKVFAAEE